MNKNHQTARSNSIHVYIEPFFKISFFGNDLKLPLSRSTFYEPFLQECFIIYNKKPLHSWDRVNKHNTTWPLFLFFWAPSVAAAVGPRPMKWLLLLHFAQLVQGRWDVAGKKRNKKNMALTPSRLNFQTFFYSVFLRTRKFKLFFTREID